MDFEWDEAKNRSNLEKHGVGFELVHDFDWDSAGFRVDDRHDYGERRFLAYGNGPAGRYVIAFTVRNGKYRIISVRPFGRKDHRFYDPAKNG